MDAVGERCTSGELVRASLAVDVMIDGNEGNIGKLERDLEVEEDSAGHVSERGGGSKGGLDDLGSVWRLRLRRLVEAWVMAAVA